MKRIKPLAIAVIVLALLAVLVVTTVIPAMKTGSVARPQLTLPAGPITAYRLNPDADEAATTANLTKFRDWLIVQQTSGPVAKELDDRVRTILDNSSTYSDYASMCMQPELGLRIGEGDSAVDVIISIPCRRAQFRRGSGLDVVPLSAAGAEQLARIFQELFPEAPPATAP